MINNISLVILTCEKRYATVGNTLKSILESDYRGDISVVNDKRYATSEDGMSRVNEAVRGIFKDFYASGKEYLLYLEDDVIVNKHIQHNLSSIVGDWECVVLCNWGDMQPGGQGLLLKRDLIHKMLSKNWLSVWDGVLYNLIDKENIPMMKHKPSLVEHLEGVSAITDEPTPHYAIDFDINWCSDKNAIIRI